MKKNASAQALRTGLMGGAGLIASFLDEGQIDEFIIHVIPTFIGEGIPLIAPRHRTVPLTLCSCRRYSDGVVRLHYSVVKRGSGRKGGRNARRDKALQRTAPRATKLNDR